MRELANLEQRVAMIDAELAAVRRDLRALRQERTAPPVAAAPFSAPPPAPPRPARPVFVAPGRAEAAPARATASAAPRGSLEDLLAGRVMAWAGGTAVLVGLILFLALAVSRGWVGEEERTVLAGLASLLLMAGGARAYERRGHTEAAVAATAAGVAGGFATLAVATEVYALIPAAAGLPAGFALGAAAAALALRWRSRTIAVLGIAGGLVSPVLVGADAGEAVTVGLLAAAYAGAATVCVALGWARLGLLAFALVTPQWAFHLIENGDAPSALALVAAFWVLGAVAAAGHSLRAPAAGFPLASHLLLALAALAAAAGGWAVLWETPPSPDGGLWLAGLAAAHLAAGLAGLRAPRVPRTLALAALALAVVLGDLALGALTGGLPVALVYVFTAAGFAVLLRARHDHALDAQAALLGLGGHLALATAHALAQEAPLGALGGGGSGAGLVAVGAVAAACMLSARLGEDGRPGLTGALDAAGLVALAYTTALAFGGPALAVAWAAEAAALAALARRFPVAVGGAWSFLAAAATAALATAAPPLALATGLDDVPSAALAMAAVAAAAVVLSAAVATAEQAAALRLAAAAGVLHLASTVLVTLVDGQPGQLALSALWGATGLAALLVGVARDRAAARTAGLALLAVAAAKVFVVDLASLDSLTRVGSFLVVGCLLLAGAFAWQRSRGDGSPSTGG